MPTATGIGDADRKQLISSIEVAVVAYKKLITAIKQDDYTEFLVQVISVEFAAVRLNAHMKNALNAIKAARVSDGDQ
jgi:hypothetical protein